jgi:hypothetical protein
MDGAQKSTSRRPSCCKVFVAALSGGLIARLIDYLVAWIKASRSEKKSAKALVDAHLDPLLKAADAIVGKTTSLAERDFSLQADQHKPPSTNALNQDLIGLAYLYARFWGRIEILAEESLGMSLASDERGAKLQRFIACLGSQRIRLRALAGDLEADVKLRPNV